MGFPRGSDGKESACNIRDLGCIPGWDDPLEGMATHSSILAWRVPMDRGAWWAIVQGVAKSYDWATKHTQPMKSRHEIRVFKYLHY